METGSKETVQEEVGSYRLYEMTFEGDNFDNAFLESTGMVTIRVQQTPQLETLLGEDSPINIGTTLYDRDITVNGLYGNYTKIICGEIGEADEPFVFLLTEEGRVDYIDILPCLQSGYFCGGPLLGVANVKDLTQSSADGLPVICAVTKGGTPFPGEQTGDTTTFAQSFG